jgi:predicted DNA-binding transcriptional regulator AlpA
MDTESLLRESQVAQRLGVSMPTLRSWRCRGIGPNFVKLGNGKKSPVRYHHHDLEQYIAQGRQHVSQSSVQASNED